jgi:uncharacterized protein YjbI with pentapeptide repeats
VHSNPIDQDSYYEQKFDELNLNNEAVDNVEFYDCIFNHCAFQECRFIKCRFVDCEFKSCNLTLANLQGCSFNNVHFEACQLAGINWANADIPNKPLQVPLKYINCSLKYSVFLGVSLIGVAFQNCVMHEVDFSEADLTQAVFHGCDLLDSRFANTNLSEADFSTAKNYTIDARNNILKKTRFSLPEAVSLLRCLDIELVE